MARRLKVTIVGYYEIPDYALEAAYGDANIDAAGIAKIDMENYQKVNVGAEDILGWCDQEEIDVKIEPA